MIACTLQLPIPMLVMEFDQLEVTSGESAHLQLCQCAQRYRDALGDGDRSPGAVPGVEHARDLFRQLGIDPTRRRPSSESLLNRALKDKPMPKVNTLVDAGNLCSLKFLLPLGLYDCATIDGPVTLRLGEADEGYLAISNRRINLAGRYLLADAQGPFGSPMTDSLRTAVSMDTTAAAIFVYAPTSYDAGRLEQHGQLLSDRVMEHCGGRLCQLEVLR